MDRIRLDTQLAQSEIGYSLLSTDQDGNIKFFPPGERGQFLRINDVDGDISWEAKDFVNDVQLETSVEGTFLTVISESGGTIPHNITNQLKTNFLNSSDGIHEGETFTVKNGGTVAFNGVGLNITFLPGQINFIMNPLRFEFINLSSGNSVTLPSTYRVITDVKRNGLSLLQSQYSITNQIISFESSFFDNESIIVLGF